jgi:hypothetical protein
MATKALSRWRIQMNRRLMDDLERSGTIAGIGKMSASSPLIQIPAIAASVAALVKKGAALTSANEAVAADEKQLQQDGQARDSARSSVDLELLSLKGLVVNNATSASDVTSMGFVLATGPTRASPVQPEPPPGLLVKLGRQHGKARVTVDTPARGGRYVAEVSTDPIGSATWSPLPGNGKQRKLSGYASGTRLWVRFAAVRYGMQSEWCAAALVIIP